MCSGGLKNSSDWVQEAHTQKWDEPRGLSAADRMFTLLYNEGKLNLLAPRVPVTLMHIDTLTDRHSLGN